MKINDIFKVFNIFEKFQNFQIKILKKVLDRFQKFYMFWKEETQGFPTPLKLSKSVHKQAQESLKRASFLYM